MMAKWWNERGDPNGPIGNDKDDNSDEDTDLPLPVDPDDAIGRLMLGRHEDRVSADPVSDTSYIQVTVVRHQNIIYVNSHIKTPI